MMDTILNLGLNDEAVEGLKARTGNGRFAYDSYRRFMQMFGNVVLEIPKEEFEQEFDAVKEAKGAKLDTDLDEQALRDVVERYKGVVKHKTGKAFPQDPMEQLRGARNAVFRSWNNARAKEYRRIYDIPDSHRHRGQRAADGVRQHRRPVGHGRGLHPQPGDRQEGVLRRVPDQRAGRGRRVRRPHADADHAARAGDAGRLQGAAPPHHAAREALQGHPGLRVHDPEREALHAADAARQAHRLRRGRDRDRPGGREAAHAERGAAAGRPVVAVAAARAGVRPEGVEGDPGGDQGPAGLAGRGVAARSCSRPTRRSSGPSRARRSSSSARRRCPTTSTACSWRRAS